MSAKNRRKTQQGEAILAVLQDTERALTASDLLSDVQIALPTINAATLYRNLHKMEERGDIQSISVAGKTFFEITNEPHHHFYCHGCGTLINIDAEAINVPQAKELMQGSGYSAEEVTLVVEGMCPNCSNEQPAFSGCANCPSLCDAVLNSDGTALPPCAQAK